MMCFNPYFNYMIQTYVVPGRKSDWGKGGAVAYVLFMLNSPLELTLTWFNSSQRMVA